MHICPNRSNGAGLVILGTVTLLFFIEGVVVCNANDTIGYRQTREWREVRDSIILVENQDDFLNHHILATITPSKPVLEVLLKDRLNPHEWGTISIIKDIFEKPTAANATYAATFPELSIEREGEGLAPGWIWSPYTWSGADRSTAAFLICPPETISGNLNNFPRTWVPVPSFLQLALTFNPSGRIFDAQAILNKDHPTDDDVYWLLIELNANPKLFKGALQPEFLNYYKHLAGLVRSVYVGSIIDLTSEEDRLNWMTTVADDDLSGKGLIENQYYDLLGVTAAGSITLTSKKSRIKLFSAWINILKGGGDPRAQEIVEGYKPLIDHQANK